VRVFRGPRWRWEAFAQHEYDAFRRLLARGLVGTGPALQLVDRPAVAALLGAAAMLELERLDRREGVADAGRRDVSGRASFYLAST
jgi:hypothetical protein